MKEGDLVRVRAAGTKVPAADPENLWEIIHLDEAGNCTIRNNFDQARAKVKGKNTSTQDCHTSMLIKVPEEKIRNAKANAINKVALEYAFSKM